MIQSLRPNFIPVVDQGISGDSNQFAGNSGEDVWFAKGRQDQWGPRLWSDSKVPTASFVPCVILGRIHQTYNHVTRCNR